MSLYSEWQAIADVERTPGEAKKFWKEYFALETENYKTLLGNYQHTYSGKVSELAEEFHMDEVTFLGFLDGINTSLKKELKLDSLKSGSKIELFGKSRAEELAQQFGIANVARVPFDPELTNCADRGLIELFEGEYLDKLFLAVEEAVKDKKQA